jgi:hypothetical protein
MADAQGGGIVGHWTAGPVWNVKVLSGDERAAVACAQLFSYTSQAYWGDGSWSIFFGPGWISVICSPKHVIYEPGEGTFRIQGLIAEGMYASTVVTGKVTYRNAQWWDMEIHLVKGDPAPGSGGFASAFEATFELELQLL